MTNIYDIEGTLFNLEKTRVLAAENGSTSPSSIEGDSWSFNPWEISLEPFRLLFWSRLLAKKTSLGVCIIKTVSGFGALHETQNHVDDQTQ